MTRKERLLRAIKQYSWLLIGVGLLSAAYLLPPDTSLAEVERVGTLTACVPSQRQPLVTGNPEAPGIDVEILNAVAGEMGLRLRLATVPAMGQDFNPRSWRLTRAQCAIVAGGLVDSRETRSFLQTSPPYATTGWVAFSASGNIDLNGRKVGVYAVAQGADRIALSSYLRSQNAQITLMRTPQALADAVAEGTVDVAVSEALLGQTLASDNGWTSGLLPPPLESYPLVFGLWKGDLTLKRAMIAAFEKVQQDGTIDAIIERYATAA